MMRYLTAICLLFSLMSCKAQNVPVAQSEKPNIIIFYIDDMGYAQPSSYGGKLIDTPNIDSFSKNGMTFTNGYSSGPVCSPSRVGILTGRYQARTGHDAVGGGEGRELDIKEIRITSYNVCYTKLLRRA